MITYERSRSWPVAAVVGALLVLGGGLYWWTSAPTPVSGGAQLAASGAAPGWIQPGTGVVEGGNLLKPQVLSDGRPADITSEDWDALKKAMARVGAPPEAAGNIVNHLRYQKGFDAWQQVDATKEASKRHHMAQVLLDDLPERVEKGEFTLVESMLMGAALIADLESDEARRNQQLKAWQTRMTGILPVPQDDVQSQNATREIELKRRQATAFAEWQALKDPAERTPAKLEQSLEEVRRAYNARAF